MSGSTSNIAAGFQVPQQSSNPLQMLGQVVGIGNALNVNRRENETFQAQKQIGEAMRQSLNPETGEMDTSRFKEAIANNPLASFLAPQALSQAKALQLGNLQIQQQQAVVGMQRLNNLRQTLGGLLANPNVSRQDVVSSVGNLLALPENERPFSASVAASSLASLPTDSSQLRQWLLQHMLTTDQGIAHAQQFLPQPVQLNTGGQVSVMNRDPITGTVTGAPGSSTMPMTPTPAERNEAVQDIDPATGRPRVQPRQQTLPMYDGQGRPINGGGQQAPGPLGTGRYPTAGGNVPPVARPNAASPPVATPPDQAQTGWRPGEAEAETQVAKQGAEDASQLMRTAGESRNMDAILLNLDQLVQQFASGPGAAWQRVATAAWNRHVPVKSWEFNPSGIASQEEFNKQVLSLASQQFQALGGTGTDGQLAQVLSTSPNELLTRQGNRGIVAMLRGNVRALEVKSQEWQRWRAEGNGADTYHKFNTQFNQQYDPRVFQSLYLSPTQRKQTWEAMNDSDKASYRRAWGLALERGWVQLPPAAGGR